MSEMLEQILSDENVKTACKRVYANKGAGGVDGVTTKELEEYMKANWCLLNNPKTSTVYPFSPKSGIIEVQGKNENSKKACTLGGEHV